MHSCLLYAHKKNVICETMNWNMIKTASRVQAKVLMHAAVRTDPQ